jgi:3-hydroxyacyl-CoA dehydrogenase
MTAKPYQPAIGVAETGIRRAAVIGAGSMGSGIAAQFANAGIPVDLLDIVGEAGRNAYAEGGVTRQIKAGGFMGADGPALVRVGNVEDDLERLAEADWIVEAVIEDLAIKRDLYARIDSMRRPRTIISSNTSTIPRAELVAGQSEAFGRDFVITHFFNPPRVMKLVEIVSAQENDPEIVARAALACRDGLGKTVVMCRDTPGFIANRIGCFWLAVGALEAIRLGLTVEEADAVHAALGIPRTGVFGLLDLIGVDLAPHVWGSLIRMLPAEDDTQNFDLPGNATIQAMIASGRHGRKTGQGFYRKAADGSREALDLATSSYRPEEQPSVPGYGRDLKALLADTGKLGAYANAVLSRVVAYTLDHADAIAENPDAIDTAIALGYSWKDGPFQLARRAGLANAAGRSEPASPSLLSKAGTISGNSAATLLDIGDDVACFRIQTKMNTLAPEMWDALEDTIARAGKDYRALVIGNDDPRAFSAGADLSFIMKMIDSGGTAAVDAYIGRGQRLLLDLKYLAVPVVAAAHGFALGGGCELMLHTSAVIAHAELNAGLPETKVGLIPAWGGCKELLLRSGSAKTAFAAITPGAVTGSALQARAAGLLRPTNGIVMHRDRLVPAAKEKALSLIDGFAVPARAVTEVEGPSGKAALVATVAEVIPKPTETDLAIADILATILTGGPSEGMVDEEHIMALERAALAELITRPSSRARMEHMLKTGKPLRN